MYSLTAAGPLKSYGWPVPSDVGRKMDRSVGKLPTGPPMATGGVLDKRAELNSPFDALDAEWNPELPTRPVPPSPRSRPAAMRRARSLAPTRLLSSGASAPLRSPLWRARRLARAKSHARPAQ